MYIFQLPYQKDSAHVFAQFAHLPYSVFLDSGGLNRFDIIAANPSEVIITQDWRDDPFTLCKQKLKQEKTNDLKDIPEELPFTVGAIGYFSYDLGYHLAQIDPKTQFDINLPTAVIGFYDWSLIFDHKTHQTYLISRYGHDHPSVVAIKSLAAKTPKPSGNFCLTSDFHPNLNKEDYTLAFNQAKQHILQGDCYQINLARRFSAGYQGNPWVAYQKIKLKNPMPMSAFMNLKDGALLCFSPERFLSVQSGKITTQPIKGTAPRFKSPYLDQQSAWNLIASSKDRAENIMIVDLLRNDLGKCCQSRSIKVPQLCALESFANVHHLISTITGTMEAGLHPLDVLRHCFPGGSITGAPKRRSMEIIDQLEPNHRSVYCGSIAYCDVRGKMDSNIAIRSFICHEDKIHCYGGGGVIADSNVENEYKEIQYKIARLLEILESNYLTLHMINN